MIFKNRGLFIYIYFSKIPLSPRWTVYSLSSELEGPLLCLCCCLKCTFSGQRSQPASMASVIHLSLISKVTWVIMGCLVEGPLLSTYSLDGNWTDRVWHQVYIFEFPFLRHTHICVQPHRLMLIYTTHRFL